MPRSANTPKVWNEDLIAALEAREDLARRQGKASAHTWSQGRKKLLETRADIYAFRNGRIVNLPSKKLSTTVDNLCRRIIAGQEPIRPDGYLEHLVGPQAQFQGNPYLNDSYLKRIKKRSGAYAILLAFHVSPQNQVLTQEQIIQTAQHFCDEEMESNWHAGRTYGAWAGIKTLTSHDLVQKQQTVMYSQRAGGLRSEKARYSLTDNGKLFIQALLQKNPEIQREIDAVQGNLDTSRAFPSSEDHESIQHHRLFRANPYQPSPPRNIATATGRPRKAPTALSLQDEQGLREWLSTAQVGHVKEFKVGKDRRQRLHDLCDDLNDQLQSQGQKLVHASDGTGQSRKLFVTLKACSVNQQNGSSGLSPSRRPRSSEPLGPGRTLSDEASPAKMARLPPKVAAANAAWGRLVMKAPPQATIQKSIPAPARKAVVTPSTTAYIDLLDSDDDDAKGERIVSNHDIKEPPKPAVKRDLTCDLESDSSDDDFPDSVFAKAKAPSQPKAAKRHWHEDNNDFDSSSDEDGVVDLTESQERPARFPKADTKKPAAAQKSLFCEDSDGSNSNDDDRLIDIVSQTTKSKARVKHKTAAGPASSLETKVSPTVAQEPEHHYQHQLTIFIDDRERDRNSTPRTLRMELTRLVSTGSLAMVWPRRLARPIVEERNLKSGDFAFEISEANRQAAGTTPLAILIERKRIGDLVGRSFAKDHWYQLHRMQQIVASRSQQEGGGVAVLLLEGDPRTASQFVPYGALEVEAVSPYDHTIDSDEALYRFYGRAILSGTSTRFVQAKDEQGSLRAVGAFGLMAASSSSVSTVMATSTTHRRVDATAERTCLKDRLRNAGLPWQLAIRIADEMQSVERMDSLYNSIEDESCRDLVLVPLLKDVCGQIQLDGTAHGWSRAVHRLWYSALADPSSAKGQFEDLCHLVEDHALLLDKLHSGMPSGEALDALLSAKQLLKEDLPRTVLIQVPQEYKECFPAIDMNGTFYRLTTTTTNKKQAIPVVKFQTKAGPYSSSRLFVHLLDGTSVLQRLQQSFVDGIEFVTVARHVVLALKQDLCQDASDSDNCVLLIRGMGNALDQAAKRAGFRSEFRALVDMILAELMIAHQVVVLHATRLTGDRESMLQQLGLACFHFQLLTKTQTES